MCPPIIDDLPDTPVLPVQPEPVTVTAIPKYDQIVVDTKYNPVSSLLTHIEGSSWTCDFFSQILTKSTALAGQNVNSTALYQQYKRITGLELKVTSPLMTTQDTTTKSLSIVGNASIYPFVIPNVGDMFMADIGDGRTGVFRITVSERKTIYKDTAYTIEYVLEDSSDTNTFADRLGDLNSKTVETVVYVRDFLVHGQNPLLHVEEAAMLKELTDFYDSIVKRWFKSFTSNEFKTILLPGQSVPVYDHFLTKAILAFFTPYDTPEIRNVKLMNCDGDPIMKATNIWDMLLARDFKMFKYCFKQEGLISTKTFNRDPMLSGIYYSGLHFVVYPKDPILDVDSTTCYLQKQLDTAVLIDVISPIRNLQDLIDDTDYSGLTTPENPIVHSVLKDDYYVLSEAFYLRDKAHQSQLEMCLMDYLEGKAIDMTKVLMLARTCHAWGVLENYYYVPMLLILLKATVRTI